MTSRLLWQPVFSIFLCLAAAGQHKEKDTNPRFNVIAIAENGGHHIEYSKAAKNWLNKLAADSNFTIHYIENTSSINDSMLAQYQLFIQLDYPPYGWTEKAVAAFQKYIEQGKGGWLGFHHASLLGEFDGYPIWQWFSGFMGGIRYKNYIAGFVSAKINVEDKTHPCMLPAIQKDMTPKYNSGLLTSAILLALGISSCYNSSKRVLIDNQFAEGNIKIGKDTIRNGLIKYYDTATNQLVRQGIYRNDTLEGEEITYNKNGTVLASTNYLNGLENGYLKIYDTTGAALQKLYYFHGQNVGPIIEYSDNRINEFRYHSFDNDLLFTIKYDGSEVEQVKQMKYLFFSNRNFSVTQPNTGQIDNHFFIYVINPPVFDFRYTLSVFDSSTNKIVKTLRKIDKTKIWDDFTIEADKRNPSGQSFALTLDIYKNDTLLRTEINKLKY